MNRPDTDWRVLLFALLGVLLIRLLAWGGSGDTTAYAGHLNQTIPTMTPTGGVVTPPTREPTEPPDTPQPPSTATFTPTPGVSITPSATFAATGSPTATAATPTDEGTLSPTPSAPPLTASETPRPIDTASPTITLPLADTPTVMPSGTPRPPRPSPTPMPQSSASAMPTEVPPPLPTPTTVASVSPLAELWRPSCLWLLLGLVLIGAGLVILLGRRRRS